LYKIEVGRMSRENMCESFEAVDARKKLSEWVEAIDYLRMQRFYLRTHYKIERELRYMPGELDRVYDLLTVYDRESNMECVVCPICGWLSKPHEVKISFEPTARMRYFAKIASILMRHIKAAHADLFERVRRGGRIYGVTERALYQCRKCGAVEDGVIEIISHYVAEHMEVDE
jgi:hypothetical protein